MLFALNPKEPDLIQSTPRWQYDRKFGRFIGAELTQNGLVDDSNRENLDSLLQPAIIHYVKGELKGEGIDKGEKKPEYEASNTSGYNEPAHNDVRCLIS